VYSNETVKAFAACHTFCRRRAALVSQDAKLYLVIAKRFQLVVGGVGEA